MGASHTSYETTYNLTELDVRNIQILAEHSGRNMSQAVHDAIYFCQIALQFNKSGKVVSVFYKNSYQSGTTASINASDVANVYNNRPKNAQPVNLRIHRHTDALQAIDYIRKTINASNDSVAVAFALEYAATAVRRIQSCNNGKFARLFFSRDNNPYNGGSILKKHPYDLTLGSKFRRTGRKVKAGMSKINPFKKSPSSVLEDKPAAPAPSAPPQQPPSAVEDDPPQHQFDGEIEKMQDGVTKPVKTLKPVTFRKPGGFNL